MGSHSDTTIPTAGNSWIWTVTQTGPDGATTVSLYQYGRLQSVTRKDSAGTVLVQCTYGFDFFRDSTKSKFPSFGGHRNPHLFILLNRPAPPYIVLMNFVGIGYDVHPLVVGRKLILGGVEIPHTKGLEGHSDADALMHAICDALLGALGEGDIGTFFPNSDPRWKGAPSAIFLQEAARQVALRKGQLINVDATIIAQQPKIFPHVAHMKRNIAAALGIDPQRVGIKATTNECLGFVGREEGIAAMAVASVELP